MATDVSLQPPVVVRSPNWLGDAIISFPAVRNLKALLGQAPLTVAAPAKLAAIWRACYFVDHVLVLEHPRSYLASSQALRTGRFGSAILLPNSLRVALEAKLAGIPQIIGYAGHFRRWLLSHVIEKGPLNLLRQHQQFHYIDLVGQLGGPENIMFPLLKKSSQLCIENQISICPGAEYGPAKRWPVENFSQIAKTLHEETGAKIKILGAAKDVPVAEELVSQLPFAENRVGKTTLEELMEELAQSRLVVCNDSGSMHLASALGTPCVAIFGSTEPKLTGPLGLRTRFLRHHVPCSPCFLRRCPLDFSCMTQIQPEQVLQEARQLLS